MRCERVSGLGPGTSVFPDASSVIGSLPYSFTQKRIYLNFLSYDAVIDYRQSFTRRHPYREVGQDDLEEVPATVCKVGEQEGRSAPYRAGLSVSSRIVVPSHLSDLRSSVGMLHQADFSLKVKEDRRSQRAGRAGEHPYAAGAFLIFSGSHRSRQPKNKRVRNRKVAGGNKK